MVTADLPLTSLTVRAFTGVRQRVLLALLAATLAVFTQQGPTDPPPNGEQGHLNVPVEIGGHGFRFACQGSGGATVLFLESAETASPTLSSLWFAAQTEVEAFARMCALFATSVHGQAALLDPAMTDQIATDLDRVLADQGVPAPYVIVSAAELAPVTIRMVDGNPALVNGGLVLELANNPLTGWVIRDGANRRPVNLGAINDILIQIRSLIWPPRTI